MSVKKEDCALRKWDIIDHLDSEEMITAYLEAVFEEGDPDFIIKALNDVARARGVNELAKKMGVTREGLYKSLNGKTEPKFKTIYKALNALGIKLVPVKIG